MNAEQKQAAERLEGWVSKSPNSFLPITKDIQTLLKAVREMGEDRARLEYLIQSGDYVRCRSNNISEGWVCVDALARFTSTVYETPRQAIDAAMGNTKERLLECEDCHQLKPDVREQECPYASEINNEVVNVQICDACYHERSMDI